MSYLTGLCLGTAQVGRSFVVVTTETRYSVMKMVGFRRDGELIFGLSIQTESGAGFGLPQDTFAQERVTKGKVWMVNGRPTQGTVVMIMPGPAA